MGSSEGEMMKTLDLITVFSNFHRKKGLYKTFLELDIQPSIAHVIYGLIDYIKGLRYQNNFIQI